jgi:hypothetical protein
LASFGSSSGFIVASKRKSLPLSRLSLTGYLQKVDLPERDLYRGQAGTIVESLAPDVFEVEFFDNEGRAYASLTLKAEQLLVLHHEPMETV